MGLRWIKLLILFIGFAFLQACTNAVPNLSGLNIDSGLSSESGEYIVLVSGGAFSSTLVNFSSQQTVVIKNQSAKNITLNSMSFSSGAPFSFVGGSYPGSGVSSGCGTSLTAGATCSLNVQFAPAATAASLTANLSISLSEGSTSATNIITLSGSSISSHSVSVGNAYTGSNIWNTYVKNNGTKSYNATGTACVGTESGEYTQACIHAAEIKKVQVPALANVSCSNLSISDNLNLFDWACDDSLSANTGLINFFSTSLKKGKGLRNLIQRNGSSGSWSPNYIEVHISSGALAGSLYASSSPSESWWSNAVQQLPDNVGTASSTLLSDTTHPIYVAGSDQSTEGGYQIGADGISIVTLGSSVLSQVGSAYSANCKSDGGSTAVGLDTRGVFCAYQKKFLWFEVNVSGGYGIAANYAAAGLILNGTRITRIQDSKFSSFNGATAYSALRLISSAKNLLSNIETYNVNSALSLDDSDENLVRQFKASKIVHSSTASAFSLNSSDANKFTDIQISGMVTGGVANGIYSNFSDKNIFQRVFISNIDAQTNLGMGVGIELSDATNHVLSQITIAGVEGAGMQLDGAIGTESNYISNINLINNMDFGLQFWGGLVSNNMFNSLVTGNNDVNISIYGAAGTPSINNNFYNTVSTNSLSTDGSIYIDLNYEANFNGYTVTRSTGTNSCMIGTTAVTTNLTSACRSTPESAAGIALSSFVGKVTSDDSSNTVDSSGTSAFSSLASVEKWLTFAFGFRGWSRDGSGNFPDATNQGPCDGSFICRIWDFRVKAGTALANSSFSYTTANNTISFTNGSCGGSLTGNDTFTVGSSTFMKYAIEIDDDGIGNDNGLCESNENCTYAPNIGAYQGEGGIDTTGYCKTDTNGVSVVNAKIYKYTTTSVP